MSRIKRREFIMLLGSAAAWPRAARAQRAVRLPTIGLLGASTPVIESQRLAAFYSGCTSSVGSRVAPLLSSIAGRMESAMPKPRPSSSS